MKKDNKFWYIITIIIVVILYRFALNGRYEFDNESGIINDKWKKRSMRFHPHSLKEWEKWGNDLYKED